MKKYIPNNITLFIKIYISVLFIFSLFRTILFFTETKRINETVAKSDILYAFVMGLRFDIVISGYILILPYILLSIFYFWEKSHKTLKKILFTYIFVLFSIAFFVCAVDIPYFNYFFARFSVFAFQALDSPVFVTKMIFQEPRYWLILIPFIFVIFLFFRHLQRVFSTTMPSFKEKKQLTILFSVLFLGLMLLGIRGRIEQKSPIRVGTAYFCDNAFLNQLGLNPNFTLIRSWLDSQKPENKQIHLMENEIAIQNVQEYLGIHLINPDFPLLRNVAVDSNKNQKHNVILIIMESMSAAKMGRHGNPNHLTPFLDSLSYKGYYFENTYTAGIHTFNGIFSTLFSFPALFRQHPMKESSILKYHGLFSTLKAQDYATLYFTTHDGQFDNVEGFLKANDCERIVSKPDYPPDKVKTTLGVPDDYMFEFSIPILNQFAEKNKPFCAAFMTASDHGPYYIPPYFTPKSKVLTQQSVEYADFALRKMIHLCSQQKWFENTIFVFVADHGASMDGLYDMSLDYNHSPLLFYAPHILPKAQTFSEMAGQIDVFPSLMHLLKLPYQNNTMGINLFTEKRPYIFCNADDKYGVIDHEWFLIVRNDKSESLYKYRERNTHNFAAEEKEVVANMKKYAESHLQSFQYVIQNKKQ